MNDKLFDLYGYTWDEAPKHLKKYALHLSGALKIDKFEAYELLINKCFEKEVEEWRQTPPSTLAEPDLSFKDDENPHNDPHLWRGV